MTDTFHADYHGTARPLFGLHMKTAALTLLTLGLYRFWAKTRIRKYIWSATSADGDSFEYTGTGLEKFLGFLIAVVVLAVYLGLLQLVLTFFGLSLLTEAETDAEMALQVGVSNLSLLAILPLIFFAQYRARRYRMARTRWRGLRFGMDSAAWGYVWRALGHLFLTLISFGLLWPRQTFYLEKYMADRTWYGDGKFTQTGRWQALYPGFKHIFLGLAVLLVTGGLAIALSAPGLGVVGILIGYVWVMIGFVYYRIYAFNYLTAHKLFDAEVRFSSEARLGQVVRILIVGGLVLIGVAAVGGALVSGILVALLAGSFDLAADPASLDPAAFILPGLVTSLFYIALLLVLSGVSLVLITQKILGHVVQHVTILNAAHLAEVHQRAADTGADAEGFADALDVGSAF